MPRLTSPTNLGARRPPRRQRRRRGCCERRRDGDRPRHQRQRERGNGAPRPRPRSRRRRACFRSNGRNAGRRSARHGDRRRSCGVAAHRKHAAREPELRGTVTVERAELADRIRAIAALAAGFHRARASSARSRWPRELSLQAEPQLVELNGVNAELLGMRVSGEGSLHGRQRARGPRRHRRVHAERPAAGVVAAAVPPTVDVGALGTLALDARFDTSLDTGRAALRDFTMTAFGATISGNLEGLPGERGNVFRGSLTTSRFAADVARQRRSRRCCRRLSRRASSA